MPEQTYGLTTGNAAKIYCLNWIAAHAQRHAGPLTLLDLGCGDGSHFVQLLRAFPAIRYVGIEPDAAACQRAREQLAFASPVIIQGYAYEGIRASLPLPAFDLIVSFSVLEHVYRRQAYMQFIHDCLAPDGVCLMNYDFGHFNSRQWKEQLKTLIGPWLARLGDESRYQAFVRWADFQRWAAAARLEVVEARMFNTQLKGLARAIPAEHLAEYHQRWLELELWLNTLPIPYHDGLARTWYTRNVILRRFP